jgi:hypothetical protein
MRPRHAMSTVDGARTQLASVAHHASIAFLTSNFERLSPSTRAFFPTHELPAVLWLWRASPEIQDADSKRKSGFILSTLKHVYLKKYYFVYMMRLQRYRHYGTGCSSSTTGRVNVSPVVRSQIVIASLHLWQASSMGRPNFPTWVS